MNEAISISRKIKFNNVVQVNNRAPVHTEETIGVKPQEEIVHGCPAVEGAIGSMQASEVPFALYPEHIF